MKRYVELDALRTIAILLMVVYHTVYDLWAFYDFALDPLHGAWRLFARVTAILFLLLVGASFVVSWERRGEPLLRSLWRAGIVLLAALLVTGATYLFDPETYVRFGILHMIGVSLLLLVPLRGLQEWNALLGIVILSLTGIIRPPSYTTIDYYPMIPWFGVVLIGFGLGHLVYVRLKRVLHTMSRPVMILTIPGRHSLLIYLIHQPLLLLALRMLLGPVS